MNIGQGAMLVFVMIVWLLFRGMIKSGVVSTKWPVNYIFMLSRRYSDEKT